MPDYGSPRHIERHQNNARRHTSAHSAATSTTDARSSAPPLTDAGGLLRQRLEPIERCHHMQSARISHVAPATAGVRQNHNLRSRVERSIGSIIVAWRRIVVRLWRADAVREPIGCRSDQIRVRNRRRVREDGGFWPNKVLHA